MMNDSSSGCHPLSITRKIEDFPIGNIRLADHQRSQLDFDEWVVHPHAWIFAEDVEGFLDSGHGVMCDALGAVLIWRDPMMERDDVFVAKESFMIRYPWDLLRANECYLGSITENFVQGVVHSSAVIEGLIHVGKGTRILPGVFIEGVVVIGDHCKIGPNCYIRGHTSIGDGCHIGQSVEIKNSVILSGSNVGHLSYIGDSVIGEKVNLGAGTCTSNLRHDGMPHRSMVDGRLVDTGRRKFGAIFGDGTHTGINTSIYPGRKFWPGTSTLPGEIVQRDVMI